MKVGVPSNYVSNFRFQGSRCGINEQSLTPVSEGMLSLGSELLVYSSYTSTDQRRAWQPKESNLSPHSKGTAANNVRRECMHLQNLHAWYWKHLDLEQPGVLSAA